MSCATPSTGFNDDVSQRWMLASVLIAAASLASCPLSAWWYHFPAWLPEAVVAIVAVAWLVVVCGAVLAKGRHGLWTLASVSAALFWPVVLATMHIGGDAP